MRHRLGHLARGGLGTGGHRVLPGCRVALVALAANRFTVADPADARMMDLAGFDAQILAAFLEGSL